MSMAYWIVRLTVIYQAIFLNQSLESLYSLYKAGSQVNKEVAWPKKCFSSDFLLNKNRNEFVPRSRELLTRAELRRLEVDKSINLSIFFALWNTTTYLLQGLCDNLVIKYMQYFVAILFWVTLKKSFLSDHNLIFLNYYCSKQGLTKLKKGAGGTLMIFKGLFGQDFGNIQR